MRRRDVEEDGGRGGWGMGWDGTSMGARRGSEKSRTSKKAGKQESRKEAGALVWSGNGLVSAASLRSSLLRRSGRASRACLEAVCGVRGALS